MALELTPRAAKSIHPRRPRVALLYKSLPQYRRQFYELLRQRLDERDVDLVLIYGDPGGSERSKLDSIDLNWATKIENRVFKVVGSEVYWQPCLGMLRSADLVIVEQATRLLINYLLLLQHLLGRTRLAFWGHGRNLQAENPRSLPELVKRFMSRRVHWWFAYTNMSAEIVRGLGFPDGRITVVQNAIDTRCLYNQLGNVSREYLAGLRHELGVTGSNVCIYCGGMYEEKRLSFLLEAAQYVRRDLPDFELILLGSGPEREIVEKAAAHHSWIRYVGPKFDSEKVPYFALSKLQLMPGLVGLAVLDSFALAVPLVTTDVPFHSPEIEYLVDGYNGAIVRGSPSPRDYAEQVTRLLKDEPARRRLVHGARESATLYTVETMADRFADGVVSALTWEK